MKKLKEHTAFTLAEVLITLAVIGVVAALTIPSLVAKYQETQTVAKLRKINSTLQNAFNMLKLKEHDGLDVENWENLTTIGQDFSKYMKTTKYCPSGTGFECFTSKNDIKKINGKPTTLDWNSGKKVEGMMLNDGTAILFFNYYITDWGHWKNSKTQGQIFVDINGKNPPNTLGKDIFSFAIKKNGGIAPNGEKALLNIEQIETLEETNHYGVAFTAWVIYNGNMDYLKYIK